MRNITRHRRQKSDRSLPFLEQRGFAAVLWDRDGVLVDSGYNFYHAYEMEVRRREYDAGLAERRLFP